MNILHDFLHLFCEVFIYRAYAVRERIAQNAIKQYNLKITTRTYGDVINLVFSQKT